MRTPAASSTATSNRPISCSTSPAPVWVTDFGLAKTADDDLTVTGDLPGTLRDIAPERFEGSATPAPTSMPWA